MSYEMVDWQKECVMCSLMYSLLWVVNDRQGFSYFLMIKYSISSRLHDWNNKWQKELDRNVDCGESMKGVIKVRSWCSGHLERFMPHQKAVKTLSISGTVTLQVLSANAIKQITSSQLQLNANPTLTIQSVQQATCHGSRQPVYRILCRQRKVAICTNYVHYEKNVS